MEQTQDGTVVAERVTAAEKAMQDIRALLDGYSEQWRREIDVVMDLHRIVGEYDMERIGEGAR